MLLLDSVSKVIDALGGNVEVGKLTGAKKQSISNWKSTGRIPAKFFLIMRHELRVRGYIAPPELWGIQEAGE